MHLRRGSLNEVWDMNPRDSRESAVAANASSGTLNEVWGMNPRDSNDTSAERLTIGPAQRSLRFIPQRQSGRAVTRANCRMLNEVWGEPQRQQTSGAT